MVTIYALLVCKIFGLKIRSCKFFDKSQVCTGVPYLVMSKWCWRGSYRSWAQFVYASHEQWKLEPSTPRVSQWRGMVYHPPSINYHDVKKSSWWHDVPHCSLPHCAMMYLLPTTMMLKRALDDMMYHIVLWHYDVSSSNYHGERMSIECMCATVATLAISGCVLRNNRYHFWGPFIWKETISSPFLLYFVTRIPGLCKCWLVLYTKEVVQKQRTLISVDAQRLPTRAQCGGIARG